MAQPVYTMLKKMGTEELHIFEGRITDTIPVIRCSVPNYSICKGMHENERDGMVFACWSEDSARKSAADKGRQVCGTCVSHLYETYP